MGNYFRASDVEDAVELAMRLRDQGRYDWFRGQVKNYLVVPSLMRRVDAEREGAIEKLARFVSWVRETHGLEELAASGMNAILAVAQHYGIPTAFLDFTTDPETAGFFACDAKHLVRGETSCIVCLDTHDLAELWKGMPSEYRRTEFLRIDVPNLWRLQAQQGVFLYCPYANFEEVIYDFDRILFPATHRAADAMRARMYPTRKSQLEVLLDQYFMREHVREGMDTLTAALSGIGIRSLTVEDLPEGIAPHAVNPKIPVLTSWRGKALGPWRSTYDERLKAVRRGETEVRFKIDPAADPAAIAAQVREEAAARIMHGYAPRETLVDWRFDLGSGAGAQSDVTTIERALDWLWDGLRTLPYSDEDLAISIGNCAGIGLAHRRTRRSDPTKSEWQTAVEAVLGSAIQIEFGADDGSFARGYAAEASLLACIRNDIAEYLMPEFHDKLLNNVSRMLGVIQVPDRLFEFDRLARVMARELSPTQVLMRPSRAVFFSPARITRIGLP